MANPTRIRLRQASSVVLTGVWLVAIACALAFAGAKLARWGTAVDTPEQSDLVPYYNAARISQEAPQLLYRYQEWYTVLGPEFRNPYPFLYTPATAVFLQPISRLPYATARRLWFWASIVSILGILWLLAWRSPSRKVGVLALLLLILSPPVLDTLHLGQINAFLGLLVCVSCLGLDARPVLRFLSGLLLGMVCCVKPVAAGLAGLALLRRRFDYVAGFASGVVLFFGVGAVALPMAVTRDYFQFVVKMGAALAPPGQTTFWNQSIVAFWRKLLGEANAGASAILGLLSAGAIVLAAAVILWRSSRQRSRSGWIEIALAFLTSLLCSPITWWHYLLIVAPVYAGVAEAYSVAASPWRRVALPLGYALIVVQRAAERLVPATGVGLLSSLMTFGLLIWFVLLAQELRHGSSSPRA